VITLNALIKPARRARKSIRALRSDKRGATLVEFGFVITPFAALMVAILQTSLTFFAQQNLETAAEKSVRQLMTGAAQRANMSQAQFKALVCTKIPTFMQCSKVIVDVQQAASFAAISTAPPTITYDASGNPTQGAYTPGIGGTINIVKIMYIWDEQKGPLGFDLSTMSSGKRLLISTSVFRVEPYVS
jgi:Flp pilus assembly protein TadG